MKAKCQVYLYARWRNLILKMQHITTTQSKQKICADLDHHWSNKCYFFVCKRTGFVHQELNDIVNMTLTRFSSHWLWLESSHFVKNVTRVESPFFSTFESGPSHHKSWLEPSPVESLTLVTLSLLNVQAGSAPGLWLVGSNMGFVIKFPKSWQINFKIKKYFAASNFGNKRPSVESSVCLVTMVSF